MGSEKQAKLENYMANRGIDIAFLQEGDMTYRNAESEGMAGVGNFLAFEYRRVSQAVGRVIAASS